MILIKKKYIKYLAIIPARKGSKRLANKNILSLNGKPLVQWTIDAAKESNCFDEIIVSTDSEEVMRLAKKLGVYVPFLRPAELATDTATTVDVLLHTIKFLEQHSNYVIENIILLQPTSPLRTKEDIINSISFFEDRKANAIISVNECEYSPLWANSLPEDLSMKGFINKKYNNVRSQDLPIFYRLNGAIYIWKKEKFINEKVYFLTEKTYAFVMDQKNSIDIDNEVDFKYAEFLMGYK